MLDELHGQLGCAGQILPPEKRAQQHAGEEVAGAGKLGGLLPCHGKAHPPALPVKAAGAQRARAEAHPGEHHRAPAVQAQPLQPHPEAGLILGKGGVVLLQQQGGLGLVWGDHIRLGRQLPHAGAQLRRVSAIWPAVVPHHRVHQHQSARPAEPAVEGLDLGDLSGRAQKAAVDGVKLHPQLGPVGGRLAQLLRQIKKNGVGAGGEGGVGGEIGGEHGAALAAHGGQNRQHHGSGAASEAGKILNCGNPWCAFHAASPLRSGFPLYYNCPDARVQLTFSGTDDTLNMFVLLGASYAPVEKGGLPQQICAIFAEMMSLSVFAQAGDGSE